MILLFPQCDGTEKDNYFLWARVVNYQDRDHELALRSPAYHHKNILRGIRKFSRASK